MRSIDRGIGKRDSSWVLMCAGVLFFLSGATAACRVPDRVRSGREGNQVTVTPGNSGIEVEITTTRSVPLRSQVVSGPDRLILDFPGALPGSDLHDQAINRGQVKGIRVGLFAQNPPVTRVVIDLKSAQPYRIYPSGKTVIVRLTLRPVRNKRPRVRKGTSTKCPTRLPCLPSPRPC